MTCNRRSAVIGGLSAGMAGMARTSVSANQRARVTLGELRAAVAEADTIRVDDAARDAAADDFGHLVHHRPLAVVEVGSARSVAAVLRFASERGVPVAVRGRGHSVYGRSQAPDGIVIDLSRLHAIHDVQADRVIVDAGTTWSALLAATLGRGLAPPVLTDYLELSVGGTLVVGGVGGRIAQHGVQADNVLELDVVTGSGQRLRCSQQHHADLFDAVRAGLAQAAVITRATIALVAVPPKVRRHLLSYHNLGALLNDQRALLEDGRFDQVQGAIVAAPSGEWTFRIDAAKGFSDGRPPDDAALLAGLSDQRARATVGTLTFAEHAHRLDALERALRSNGQWLNPHPWLTTFVGDSVVESVVQAELTRLQPADLGPFGQIGLMAFQRRAVRSPMVRLPADAICHAFNLIRVPATPSVDDAFRLVADNRRAYDRVRAQGGTLYPVSAFGMSPIDWREHFGAEYERLLDAKRQFDPAGVLTPGYSGASPGP